MKPLQSMLFSLLMGVAFAAHAVNQDVQVDILMAKISASLKADRAADALPSFAELEGMEPALKKPLPENYHFYYIYALDKTGDKAKALSRADIYLNKFGKGGKNYGKVIEIMSRLQMQVEKDKAAAIKQAQEEKEAALKQAQQEKEAALKRAQDEKDRQERADRAEREREKKERIAEQKEQERIAEQERRAEEQERRQLTSYPVLIPDIPIPRRQMGGFQGLQ